MLDSVGVVFLTSQDDYDRAYQQVQGYLAAKNGTPINIKAPDHWIRGWLKYHIDINDCDYNLIELIRHLFPSTGV